MLPTSVQKKKSKGGVMIKSRWRAPGHSSLLARGWTGIKGKEGRSRKGPTPRFRREGESELPAVPSFPAPPPRPPPLIPPSFPPEPEAAAGEAAAPSSRTHSVPTPIPFPPPARHGPVTCSSKRLTTAWTHSTGLCAAMSSPRPGDGGGTGRPAPRAGKRAGSGG